MIARRIPAYAADSWPGDYWWTVHTDRNFRGCVERDGKRYLEIDGLRANCPCGCGQSFRIAFSSRGGNRETPHRFDGDQELPTILGLIQSPCGWSGRLDKGRWLGWRAEATA